MTTAEATFFSLGLSLGVYLMALIQLIGSARDQARTARTVRRTLLRLEATATWRQTLTKGPGLVRTPGGDQEEVAAR